MEKRLYQRVPVSLTSNIIIKKDTDENVEYGGTIEDVSENGLKVTFSVSEYPEISEDIRLGESISFQSVDRYEVYGKSRMDIFSGTAEVLRVENKEDKITIGCKITKSSKEYDEYVKNKKAALFMKRGCSLLFINN